MHSIVRTSEANWEVVRCDTDCEGATVLVTIFHGLSPYSAIAIANALNGGGSVKELSISPNILAACWGEPR